MRIARASIICLASGAVLNAAMGACQGKGSDEQSLLRSLLDVLACGELLPGDAFYATYFLLCALRERGINGVFEQHGAPASHGFSPRAAAGSA